MRRTKATLIYRRTKNLRAVQLLLGHTKLESTVDVDIERLKRTFEAKEAKHKAELLKGAVVTLIVSVIGLRLR
jgi:site-specific recombinase XerC